SARTLRGSEDATPSGRRREQEEERERRAAGIERGTRQGGGEEREAEEERAEPRSVRADSNRGSERDAGDARR
ncbi:hypothetical protein, partial [Paramuribaculum intestinale]